MIEVLARPLDPPLVRDGLSWPDLWRALQRILRGRGYRQSTLALYRAVLRGLARSSHQPPGRIGPPQIDFYLRRLAYARCSASWLAMNLSGLRSVESALRYCACQPPEAISPLDALAPAPIREIPVGDSTPPFPVDAPRQYFRAWFKSKLWRTFRRLRLSG